jgi:hypothetical protein
MSPSAPVHEITLGGVRASIWEERRISRRVRESDFSVSIGRADHFEASSADRDRGRRSADDGERQIAAGGMGQSVVPAAGPVRFGVEDLPLVAQVMDLAHLWIHEQSVGV